MTESQALFDKALAHVDPSTATRTLLRELFAGHGENPLAVALADMLAAIAELATTVGEVEPPPPHGAAAAHPLGDNWFQCPHCEDVFEGEPPACPACARPLAVAAPAIQIALGERGRILLRPSRAAKRMPLSDLRYVESTLDWLRVESGDRWFELFDEASQEATAAKLAAKLPVPPNVRPLGLFHDGTIVLAHPTKLELHEVANGTITALPHRTRCAPELVVRQLAAVLYPEDTLPAAPDPKLVAAKGHAREPRLEAAIEADLDQPEAYLVYADWLQAQGDPRGELIVLQHAGKSVEGARLRDRHAAHFYGAAAPLLEVLRCSNELHEHDTAWRWGYLQRLWIGQRGRGEHAIDEVLAGLLDHPSCRFLRELTVGLVSAEDNSYDEIAKVIGARELPSLHRLMLGDFGSDETELNWSQLGDVSPIYRAVPNLRALTLRSYGIELGTIDLPYLEELTIITGGLDRKALASICAATWPALRILGLQLGDEDRFTLDALAPIFDGDAFPRLVHLGLGNTTISDDVCGALAGSAIAARLEHLDLSEGTLGDDGARALAAGCFPRLQAIDVSHSYVTDAGLAILAKLAPRVIADSLRDDDGDPDARYIGARE